GAAAIAEQEALSAGTKTATEIEHAATGEAKAQALREGAQVASGESKVMQRAIRDATSAENALSSEPAAGVGERVDPTAANAAERKECHEVETAAVKGVASEVERGLLPTGEDLAKDAASPAELAGQIEARWGVYGAGAKLAIQTIGGGIVQGKSPSEILKG